MAIFVYINRSYLVDKMLNISKGLLRVKCLTVTECLTCHTGSD